MGEDEGGAVDALDDLGHGEGFAGACNSKQDLMLLAGVEAVDELVDGAGLVAAGLVLGDKLKIHEGDYSRWMANRKRKIKRFAADRTQVRRNSGSL